MLELDELGARVGSPPWSLYRSEALDALRPDQDRDGFYVGMLKDDFQKQRYAYEVSLVPKGVELAVASEVLFALLNDFNHRGYDRDPATLVCDFAETLLEESVHAKGMLLELHSLPEEDFRVRSSRRSRPSDDSARQAESWPSLGLIPAWSVVRARSDVVQVSVEAGRPAVVIPSRSILRLRLREPNRGIWRKTIRELRRVDDVKMIGADLKRFSWKGYVFSEQVAAQNLAVGATTARIGWDGRGTFSESVTSPYMAYRRLRFVRFWVEAIEDAVTFLSDVTGRHSLYGDSAFTFSLSGLPSPGDLDRAMEDLRAGVLTVEEAHSRYLFPAHAKRRGGSEDEAPDA